MARGETAYYKVMIEEALAGDSNSYAILYAATYQNLYQWAFYYTKSEYATQDILTDTYIEAFSHLQELQSPRSFRVWVRNIAQKYILRALRKNDPETWREVNALPRPTLAMRRAIYGRKAPRMSLDIAGQLLEYLFYEVGITPNTLPLDTLAEYHEYRMNLLRIQRAALTLLVFFLCLTPFWFIAPPFEVTEVNEHGVVTYNLTVDNFLSIKSVTAQVGDQFFPVTQSGKHVYTVRPTNNGDMDLRVTYFNNMTSEQRITVTGVDRDAPVVVDSHMRSGVVTLAISDAVSGIDYEQIAITSLSGTNVPITQEVVDGQETISFSYPGESVDIVIPDKAGNRLHLLLSDD